MSSLTKNRFNRLVKSIYSDAQFVSEQLTSLQEGRSITYAEASGLSKKVEQLENEFSSSCQPFEECDELPEGLSEDSFQESVQKIKAALLKLTLQIPAVPEPTQAPLPVIHQTPPPLLADSTTQGKSSVPIRRLQLETFAGDFASWSSYEARFISLIDKNEILSPSQKLQYLLETLQDVPLKLVSHLPLIDESYPIALNLLRTRYNNPRRHLTHRCQQLINLPGLTDAKPDSVRTFIDNYNVHSNALTLVVPKNMNTAEIFFAAFLLQKLSPELRLKLEESLSLDVIFPSAENIIEFLTRRAVTHENIVDLAMYSVPQQSTQKGNPKHSNPRLTSFISTPSDSCSCCNEPIHDLYQCPKFRSLPISERHSFIKTQKRCFNCFRTHSTNRCNSKYRCRHCQQLHHTLLHFDSRPHSFNLLPSDTQPNPVVNPATDEEPAPQSMLTSHAAADCQFSVRKAPVSQTLLSADTSKKSTVLLATVLIRIQSSPTNSRIIRAVLDTASHVSFVTSRVIQNLTCHRVYSAPLPIAGISNTTTASKGRCYLDVAPLTGEVLCANSEFHILTQITQHLPRMNVRSDITASALVSKLADPTCLTPGNIDALLGADLTAFLITGPPTSMGPNLPYIINTKLGQVLIGNAPSALSTPPATLLTCLTTTEDDKLSASIQRFWQIEEPPAWRSTPSAEEMLAENHFTSTVKRARDGRYEVRLPFQPGRQAELGNSYHIAFHRLLSLERKFKAHPEFHKKYVAFMREYENLGHMQMLKSKTLAKYFIPHHGIFKSHGDTAKLRVVFDASCRSSSGLSLNDILLSGEKLQLIIPNVITLFRLHPYVFTCDIKQMYRMINIHPEDQLYQCILWRESPNDPIKIFQLCTVTYGVTSAPYLALRCLKQLAFDEGSNYPNATKILETNIFVDDIITGANTVAQAASLKRELVALLERGGFALRKWCSNSPSLLADIDPDHREPLKPWKVSAAAVISVLGLIWDPTADEFILQYPIERFTESTILTKRKVLAYIAQFYDPCGWYTPTIMHAKCFMQKLWLQPLQWDDELPPLIRNEFLRLHQAFNSCPQTTLPRALPIDQGGVQLHGFCDASEKGYAAVLYLRFPDNGQFKTSLVWSRSRVAPLKTISLPRLELLGAHLLANLVTNFQQSVGTSINIESVHLWTDSTIVLAWISTPPINLKTFVANRISQIIEATAPSSWRHVPTDVNPADPASRGIAPGELPTNHLWWYGPHFLTLQVEAWPQLTQSINHNGDLELRSPTTALLATPEENNPLFSHISSWSKLETIMTFILRFKAHGQPLDASYSSLQAIQALCKYIQHQVFQPELKSLKSGQPCTRSIQRLSPFLDTSGIIRVGGRLSNSPLPYSQRHPILLPKTHALVDLLITHYHLAYLHAGPKLTHSLLTNRFWIISARQVIRSLIFKCVKCFRTNPVSVPQVMANLPAARVTPSPPFYHTGIDYAGPFDIKAHTLRRSPVIKVYLGLFICFATKAIHLEVAKDLSTDAFIIILQRFIARRGLPGHMYSDCGTNFVGADNKLRRQTKAFFADPETQRLISKFALENSIRFHFNPPASPAQGGLWERAVRSTKHHLKRVLGTHVPTSENFQTLVIRIEAILNSRPLTPLSADPNDLEALTPGHFLIGRPLTQFPEENLIEIPDNRLKHYNLLQALLQRFWQRWRREYLTGLQCREKWIYPTQNLEVGELVLLDEANLPPLAWPLGRVVRVSPGTDGKVRVAQVRTAKGIFLRPLTKLFRLPINH